jgi:hypothetical protein
MKNGRCRLHGGKSPGAPRGERNGNYRHGLRTIEAIAERRHAVEVRRALRDLLRESSFLNTEGAQQVADTETVFLLHA